MFKNGLQIILIMLLALFQVSFLYHYTPLREALNPILLGVILTSVWINSRSGLYFGLIAGLCLDIYSSFAFGLITISLTLPILLVNYAFTKWLTRRSIYSTVIIVFSSTLVYWISMLFFTNIMAWLNWSPTAILFNYRFIHLVGTQIFVNVTATVVIYVIYKFINSRFRLNFLNQT